MNPRHLRFGKRDFAKFLLILLTVVFRWGDLEEVFSWQHRHPRVDRRLTVKHILMNNYNKMTVSTAVDVASEPIEAVLVEMGAFETSGEFSVPFDF